MSDSHAPESEPMFSAREIARTFSDPGTQPKIPTPEQVEIIEYPLGSPALVIAGAGSGKTETLANRVVWLVANRLVRPEQILGLTFSVKAAGELSERIRSQLLRFADRAQHHPGLSDAQRAAAVELESVLGGRFNVPSASTYDAFASQLVQEFGAYAGVRADATIIDESTATTLALDVVAEYGTRDSLILQRQPEDLAREVAAFENAARSHLIDDFSRIDHHLQQFVRVADLPYGDIGRRKPQTVDDEIDQYVRAVQGTREIARLAHRFREEKERRGFMQFSDLIVEAYRVAQRVPEAVRTLRERFPVVLLDEVQDTSFGQTQLLSQLFRGNSVMGVGDPNQTIYAWRGAAADALSSFRRRFVEPEGDQGQELILSTSWRNPQRVLEVANDIAEPLRRTSTQRSPEHDAAPEGVTVPKLSSRVGAPDGTVTTCIAETDDAERRVLAEWIRERRDRYAAEHDGVPPTAAVLVRTGKEIPKIAAALTELGLPVQTIGHGALLNTPEVVDITSLMRCVHGVGAENDLVRILTSPRFAVPLEDIDELGNIARWFRSRDAAWQPLPQEARRPDQLVPSEELVVTNLDVIDALRRVTPGDAVVSGLSEIGFARIREVGEMLGRLRALAWGRMSDLARACERELRIDIELMAQPDFIDPAKPKHADNLGKVDARQNVDAFMAMVVQAEQTLGNGDLEAFLSWFDRARIDDETLEATPEPLRGTVQVLTMHRSKGLEWDLVGLPAWNETPSRGLRGWLQQGELPYALRGDRDSLPRLNWETVSSKAELLRELQGFFAAHRAKYEVENRRLAYVAVTRAQTALMVSGHVWAATRKRPSVASQYFLSVARTNALQTGATPHLTSGLRSQGFPAELIAGLVKKHLTLNKEHRMLIEDAEALGLHIDASVLPQSALTDYFDLFGSQDDRIPHPNDGDLSGFQCEGSGFEPAERPAPERLEWPMSALGSRETAVREAAERVHDALDDLSQIPTTERSAELSPQVRVLLAEYARLNADSTDAGHAETLVTAARGRINASSFHHAVQDADAFLRNRARPIPERPYRQTDLGNRFHEWVERYFIAGRPEAARTPSTDLGSDDGTTVRSPMPSDTALETDDDLNVAPPERDRDEYHGYVINAAGEAGDAPPPLTLETLIATFRSSRWAQQTAISVEEEITVPFAGERLVCKIDAVFPSQTLPGGVEIVDWKTGVAPRSQREREDRMFQLELYRHAYARWSGMPLEHIQACLYYVADDHELLLTSSRSFEELEALWSAQTQRGEA